jgi:hypothetical protein
MSEAPPPQPTPTPTRRCCTTFGSGRGTRACTAASPRTAASTASTTRSRVREQGGWGGVRKWARLTGTGGGGGGGAGG